MQRQCSTISIALALALELARTATATAAAAALETHAIGWYGSHFQCVRSTDRGRIPSSRNHFRVLVSVGSGKLFFFVSILSHVDKNLPDPQEPRRSRRRR